MREEDVLNMYLYFNLNLMELHSLKKFCRYMYIDAYNEKNTLIRTIFHKLEGKVNRLIEKNCEEITIKLNVVVNIHLSSAIKAFVLYMSPYLTEDYLGAIGLSKDDVKHLRTIGEKSFEAGRDKLDSDKELFYKIDAYFMNLSEVEQIQFFLKMEN